jgi:signal peptidase I
MKPIRLILLMTLAVVATVRAASPLTTTVVLGHSMEPTMRPGELRVLDRNHYRDHPILKGDVVVLNFAGETYIKRVYATPGDRLTLLRFKDGLTDVVEPRHLDHLTVAERNGHLPDARLVSMIVPPGFCFVLGDNRANSQDSRDFGLVPVIDVVGRVLP